MLLDVRDGAKESVLQPPKFARVLRCRAIKGSLLGFTITLRAESWLLESELLFCDIAEVFHAHRVHSEKQRGLAGCHGNV